MDNLVKLGAERYEKARIEKKLKQLVQLKGYNSLSKVKNYEDLLNELKTDDQLPQFRFENEADSNKESFDKYQRLSMKKMEQTNIPNKSESSAFKNSIIPNQTPTLTQDMKVSDDEKI
jgi:hypothetical protein